MGGLVDYFSRSWRGTQSESIQDLVGSAGANHQITETSLTNPDFVHSTSDNIKRSFSSELVSLPPSDQSPVTEVKQLTDTENYTDEVDDDGLFPDRSIEATQLEEGERYKEINNILNAVLQLYKPLTVRKTGIKKSLQDFKNELGLDSKHRKTTLSQCFGILRGKVHNETHIELVCAGTEPIKLKIDEISNKPTPEDVKRAVMFLNLALTTCQKFNGDKELKLADIQYKLEDLHLMPLTKEGRDLYGAINCIPTYVEEISTDIERFHQQLYEARLLLRPK